MEEITIYSDLQSVVKELTKAKIDIKFLNKRLEDLMEKIHEFSLISKDSFMTFGDSLIKQNEIIKYIMEKIK